MPDRTTIMPILTVRDLAAGYGGMPVIAKQSFTIFAGMTLILEGMNGSGKTTLLRCLAGLQPPISGQIIIGNIPLENDRVHAARKTAYIGHRDGLAAELTASEALGLWAASRGFCPDHEDIEYSFSALGITQVTDQPVRTLSQGQKRRVGMTRLALITRLGRTQETPLWLLDEPTTAMDSTATAKFAALIKAHTGAGGAAVLTSHHDTGIKPAETLVLSGGQVS